MAAFSGFSRETTAEHSLAGGASPAIAARENFEAAVADYKKCIATRSTNDCEGERHIMDAAAVAAGNSLR
jgi:hypothetical protein